MNIKEMRKTLTDRHIKGEVIYDGYMFSPIGYRRRIYYIWISETNHGHFFDYQEREFYDYILNLEND